MKKGKKCFSMIKWFYQKKYRKYNKVVLDCESAIYVSNHCKLSGPGYFEAFFPKPKKIWVIGDMLERKKAVLHAYKDFFKSGKPKWFYMFLSKVIARPFCYMIKNADYLPVYSDMRIATTLKETIKALKNNENIVIMPECPEHYSHVVHNFQRNYIEVARLYYKMTQKKLKFYPVYLGPKIKKVMVGQFIEFNPENEIEEEKTRINLFLMDKITELCDSLPKHKIIQYD